MSPKEFQEKCMQTIVVDYVRSAVLFREQNKLLHGAIGLSGEAGEVLEHVKKHVFHGKELNKNNLLLELGDLMFYSAVLLDAVGADFETVFKMNVAKLAARYPEQNK